MVRKMTRGFCLFGAVVLLASGCEGKGNERQMLDTEQAAAIHSEETIESEAAISQEKKQSSLNRTEITGLEKGLRGWYLSCTDGKDPAIECIKENGWDGYSGAGGDDGQILIYSYTMYTLKQYVIRIKDRSAKNCTLAVTAHFEKYGELIVEVSMEKNDSADGTQEVILLFVAERPINRVVYMIDGECVQEEDSPYFGMYYPE